MPITELVFGALTQNRSSLEPSLEFAAIAGMPRIENGGTFAVDFADGRRDRHNIDVQPDATTFRGPPSARQGLERIVHDPQCAAGRHYRTGHGGPHPALGQDIRWSAGSRSYPLGLKRSASRFWLRQLGLGSRPP